MKRILLLMLLCFSLGATAQQESVIVKTPATVIAISGDSALILSRHFGKTYKVPARELEQGREYLFVLKIDKALKEEKHCSGCTGILPAEILQFNTSSRQTAVDISRMYKPEKKSDLR